MRMRMLMQRKRPGPRKLVRMVVFFRGFEPADSPIRSMRRYFRSGIHSPQANALGDAMILLAVILA